MSDCDSITLKLDRRTHRRCHFCEEETLHMATPWSISNFRGGDNIWRTCKCDVCGSFVGVAITAAIIKSTPPVKRWWDKLYSPPSLVDIVGWQKKQEATNE